MGPQWSATKAYWGDPTPEREAEATVHLTIEGTRDQYGVPQDIAERIDPRLRELSAAGVYRSGNPPRMLSPRESQ